MTKLDFLFIGRACPLFALMALTETIQRQGGDQ